MNRRELIKAFAAMASLTVAGRVWAAPATDARLLVVFLRGAYDAANVVVPIGSDFYYASRPTLAHRQARRRQSECGVVADAGWGLHPALRDSIYPLWAKREIAFVPFAGTSDDLTPQPFRDPGHDRTRPGGRRLARLSVRLHEPARGRTDAREADRVHRPVAIDVPRQGADSQYRHQQCRQARRRRPPGPADQADVCA